MDAHPDGLIYDHPLEYHLPTAQQHCDDLQEEVDIMDARLSANDHEIGQYLASAAGRDPREVSNQMAGLQADLRSIRDRLDFFDKLLALPAPPPPPPQPKEE